MREKIANFRPTIKNSAHRLPTKVTLRRDKLQQRGWDSWGIKAFLQTLLSLKLPLKKL